MIRLDGLCVSSIKTANANDVSELKIGSLNHSESPLLLLNLSNVKPKIRVSDERVV